MIVKDKDAISNPTKNEAKGDAAEKQMAFYLESYFGESKDVFVFNDLRICRNDKCRQMDHLIVHQYGFVIIESKSVYGSISVNEHLQFERPSTGIGSPIEQARRQGILLRSFLADHKQELLGKTFGLMQAGFKNRPIDIIVAISDNGKIRRVGRKIEIPELMKADQVPMAVQQLIAAYRKGNALPLGEILLDPFEILEDKKPRKKKEKKEVAVGTKFKPSELKNIVKFLKASHKPRARTAPSEKASTPVAKKRPTYICTHCHEKNLSIQYGKSYYFKCHSCDGNTPIKNRCSQCNEVTRTRKSKKDFTSICKACDLEEIFFVNP